jgi:predicted transposase YdaD
LEPTQKPTILRKREQNGSRNTGAAAMNINNRFKDSVFSLLFTDPDTLRELYGALQGIPPDPNAVIEINTLTDVLFMEQINDISFTIDNRIVVLIEHQSTINPNMPLRLLMYIARVYEKITGNRNIYSGKKLTIPRPEFFVLYNGIQSCPDESVLNLSDSFEREGMPGTQALELELTVKVYNINSGHNETLVQRCKKLEGYSTFIGKIREYGNQGIGKEAAMKAAITWCLDHNILRNFLEANGSEVINMLLTEWNMKDALAVRWEEGLEEGREEGREEDIKRLLEYGMTPEQVAEALKIPLDAVISTSGKYPRSN